MLDALFGKKRPTERYPSLDAVREATHDLLRAAKDGDTKAAEEALKRGAHLTGRSTASCSAMHLAAASGHAEIVELLLRQKISDESAPQIASPTILSKTLRRRREWLDAPLLHLKDDALRTPLHAAAESGQSNIVHLILRSLDTAAVAAEPGRNGTASSLSPEQLALLNARDVHGRTALILACRTPTGRQAVAALVQWGCALDAADTDGQTALMVLSEAGEAALVRLCLRAGADFGAVDEAGETAYSLAANEGHTEVRMRARPRWRAISTRARTRCARCTRCAR